MAMQREPSQLKPDMDGTNPFSYPRLVQPVLDKHCAGCHAENPNKAPRLDREVIVVAFQQLQRFPVEPDDVSKHPIERGAE